MPLKVNGKAPHFTLPDQNGALHSLSSFEGRWVLIYFYPKDDTPGCTKEACAIRDSFPAFKKLKAVVLGISADSVKSHKKFAEKYELPFILLADEKREVVRKYDVWQMKKFMGRSYMGIVRSSFLVDGKGLIRKIYPKVNPVFHAEEVVEDLKLLQRE